MRNVSGLPLSALLLVALAACDGSPVEIDDPTHPVPQAPVSASLGEPEAPTLPEMLAGTLVASTGPFAASPEDDDFVTFLPPLGSAANASRAFDPDLHPLVRICKWQPGPELCGTVIASFTRHGGPAGTISVAGAHYHVTWHTRDFPIQTGVTYRIEVLLGEAPLGGVTVAFGRNAREARQVEGAMGFVSGQTIPIRFRMTAPPPPEPPQEPETLSLPVRTMFGTAPVQGSRVLATDAFGFHQGEFTAYTGDDGWTVVEGLPAHAFHTWNVTATHDDHTFFLAWAFQDTTPHPVSVILIQGDVDQSQPDMAGDGLFVGPHHSVAKVVRVGTDGDLVAVRLPVWCERQFSAGRLRLGVYGVSDGTPDNDEFLAELIVGHKRVPRFAPDPGPGADDFQTLVLPEPIPVTAGSSLALVLSGVDDDSQCGVRLGPEGGYPDGAAFSGAPGSWNRNDRAPSFETVMHP